MKRRFTLVVALAALITTIAAPALANKGQPNFAPSLYADGQVWGTKATTELPAPKKNGHSFDALFVITNGADGQLPVAEAAPGPDYNGGRWATKTATWTAAGMAAHGMPLPVLTSYEEVMIHYNLGHLDITDGSPGGDGAPPDYFQCPLLPVK